MMNKWLPHTLIFAAIFIGGAIPSPTTGIEPVYAQQSINVNQTTPCFLNYTAGYDMWENCGMGDDYLQTALLPWEWITGGNFSMMLAGVFVLFTYIKYHKAVYPIIIGIMMLPISYAVFPDTFLSWAIIMTFVTIGILIWYVYIRQTKEYSAL